MILRLMFADNEEGGAYIPTAMCYLYGISTQVMVCIWICMFSSNTTRSYTLDH